MKNKLLTKLSAIFLTLLINLTSFIPILSTPKSVFAADSTCGGATSTLLTKGTLAQAQTKFTPRVGAGSIDQAVKFLGNMTEITGAYYDQNLDRIVFIGKTNASLPKIDKDALAVSIKARLFDHTSPGVALATVANPDPNKISVTYTGNIENTKFGDIYAKADWKIKQYRIGLDQNNNTLTSSIPTYKSALDRYYSNPSYNPDVERGKDNATFLSIGIQTATLRKDDTNKSFVFDTIKMQTYVDPYGINDPLWDQANQDFSNEFTQNYDSYSQESPELGDFKRLVALDAIVKWIGDSGIDTDFNFARNYTPKFIQTPTTFPKLSTPPHGPYNAIYDGEANFNTPNTYVPDNGISASLKSSSQAISLAKEDVHWQFNNGGQQYEAVAVTADAFRSLGSYNQTVTDMSFPTTGDLNLSFDRTYSSFSGGQYGVGRGWSIYPAQLYDNHPTVTPTVLTCTNGVYTKYLSLVSQTGGFESFTITDCNIGYVPDDLAYHSKIVRNADSSFTATLKDQTKLNFNPAPIQSGSTFNLTSVKDKNNNPINYNYDATKKLTSISDGKGHQINMTYGADNLISSITDFSGRSVNYTYDGDGNLLTVKDPNGNITSYTYDPNFKLTTVTDRNGILVLTNTYTDEAKIATSKNAANTTNTNTYDKVNRVITTQDNNARTQVTKYDPKGRVLEYTDPLLSKLIYTYGTEFAPLTIKDKRGNTITNVYDANGNLTQLTFPDTKKINYQYDSFNRLTKILDGRYGITIKDTTNTYDASGNLTQSNEAGQLTKFTYDTTGEPITLTDALNHVLTWTRDTFGNMLTQKDALNNTTNFEYDTIARLKKQTDADAKVINYTYDNNGNLLTQADAVGTTTNLYDKENRLTKVTLPNSSVSEFTYNALGSMTSVKDPLLSTTNYGYDPYQNLSTQTDALNNITTNIYDNLNRQTQSTTPLGKLSKWEYDANGNITKRIDANNASTTYLYDAFNRLTKISYPNLTTVTFEYDNRGNRTKMIDPIGTSTYTYDNFDRLTQYKEPKGLLVKYTYDDKDNLKTLTYPDNRVVTYGYDVNDRLTTVTDWNNKVTTYTYNMNGLLATRLYPDTIKTTYTYDNANRLIDIEHKRGTSTVLKYTYERDSLGNVTKTTRSGSSVNPAKTDIFAYDALRRITSAIYGYNTADPTHYDDKFTYTYDKLGNRLTLFDTLFMSENTTYLYDKDNKLTKATLIRDGDPLNYISNYTYDNNGNQIKKTYPLVNALNNIFDFENKLTERREGTGTKHIYKYDGLGNRLEKYQDTYLDKRYISDISTPLSNLIAITNSSNKIKEWLVYGVGIISGGSSADLSFRDYYIEDGLGTIVSTADGTTGSFNPPTGYDPFGNEVSTGYGNEIFKFHSQFFQDELFNNPLYFMRARYYDQTTGRFISKDPVKGGLSNPQTQNPYAYALNNPNSFSDPSGLDYVDVNLSGGIGIEGLPLGGGMGIQVNLQGITLYSQVGSTTPGVGFSATYSLADQKPNSESLDFSVNALMVAGSVSHPIKNGVIDVYSPEYAYGISGPKVGASLMKTHTGDTIYFPWVNSCK